MVENTMNNCHVKTNNVIMSEHNEQNVKSQLLALKSSVIMH